MPKFKKVLLDGDFISDNNLKYVSYNPDTGQFIRLKPTSRKTKVGEIVGTYHKATGYVYLSINKKKYRAHRLAWFYSYGYWPENDIDHINGNRADNRLENLREATRSENMYNQTRVRKNSKIKVTGVSYNRDRYRARINAEGKQYHIGTYDTIEEAETAYLEAKKKLHGDFTGVNYEQY